ncbi:MAG: Na+/H+ antiporter NhaC [Gammaproteobacteria bacterium]|nr:Na+/H+ antiporter NhaC [Gammaproteobacteria bacterium]
MRIRQEEEATAAPRNASMTQSLIPVIALIAMLSLSVYLFGADSSGGANQIALLLGGAIAAVIAVRNGHPWPQLERAIVEGISTAMGAILILLAVGALIGAWMLAGTVPAMIYYGLQIMDPRIFYAASCLICAVASLSIGSSWTVAGTLGVGLMGVAFGLGLSPAVTAGAVVSGAYFGDKMSPLSDTTNLSPAVVGTDLFTHIRHMVWTTTPAFLTALLLFTVVGFGRHAQGDSATLAETLATLEAGFHITLWALLPLLVVFGLAMKKFPPLPTILIGALLGGVMAVFLQPAVVIAFADSPGLAPWLAQLKGIWIALATGYVSTTGNEAVDALLSRGGMDSMLTTIWLILCALAFGAVLAHAGMLERLIRGVLGWAKTTGSLVFSVVVSCIGINIVAADQYIAIVLPGRMFRAEFERRGLHVKNLSRTLEDAGTMTSALVPWNTCGAYMAAALGVPTLSYAPYAFFNLLSPVVAVIYAMRNISITRVGAGEPVPAK